MYKDLIVKGIVFAIGATAGSFITWRFLKTKYERISKEEIESVREVYRNRKITLEDVAKAASDEGFGVDFSSKEKEELEEYKSILDETGYGVESHEEEEEEDMEKPYVISPDEFGDCDYAQVSLIYYLDGIVTNDKDKIVANIDELIGEGSLNHFGEYEEDSVFVRNDKLKIDFEILKDYREYSEEYD